MSERQSALSGTPDPGKRVVPVWLWNLASLSWRVLVVLALCAAAVYLGSIVWTVVASIGLAVLVAVILAPWMLRLRASGRSRNSAAIVAWGATMLVGLGVLAVLTLSFLPYLVEMYQRLEAGHTEIQTAFADLGLPAWVDSLVSEVVKIAGNLADSSLSSVLGSVAELGGILLIGSFLLFFFLRDGDKAWRWLFQWIDEEKRERIDESGDTALQRVGDYVRASTTVAAIASITNLAFMLVLGTPLAIPLAMLTFFLAYIPYFGGIASGAVIAVVTLGAVGTPAAALVVALIFIRFLAVRFVVRPRINAGQDALTLHPAVILIVLPVGLHLGGLVGMILAVPLTAFGFSVAQATLRVLEPPIPESLPETVPGWLDGAAQWSWRILVIIGLALVLLAAMFALPLMMLPLIVALILAATLAPLVGVLVRRGQSPTLAASVAVGGTTAIIGGVLAFSLSQLAEQVPDVGSTAVSGARQVNSAAGGNLGLGVEAVSTGAAAVVSTVADIVSSLGPVVAVLVLSVLLTFYFVRDGSRLWEALIGHLPASAAEELSSAGSRAVGVLGGYMIGTGAISLVGAGSQAVIMWVLGLPLVWPIFVVSFFGGFIPYIGSGITTVLALLVAIAVGSPLDILIMVIWTLVFNIVQGNIVAPLVYNRTTHIHPAIVLAGIPAAASLAGILGMFLVVPVLGVVIVSWRSVLRVLGTDVGEPLVEVEDDVGASVTSPGTAKVSA